MNTAITLLLTSPDRALVDELTRHRPSWRILELDGQTPVSPPIRPVWAFIDWLLPELSGLELCRRLKESEATRDAHVTMILDGSDREDRRRALQAGADDYLVRPLTVELVLDRIEASKNGQSIPLPRSRLQHGNLMLDLTAHQARFNSSIVPLRPNEFRLLAHFLENPDQVFSRLALIERLGKHAHGIDERTVDVWIGRLRRALRAHGAPDPLRTVRSLGYVMDSMNG